MALGLRQPDREKQDVSAVDVESTLTERQPAWCLVPQGTEASASGSDIQAEQGREAGRAPTCPPPWSSSQVIKLNVTHFGGKKW